MKKKETFLQLHKRLIEANSYIGGLCLLNFRGRKLDTNKIFKLMKPSEIDLSLGLMEGYHTGYWCDKNGEIGRTYNELRQNIILFCAAINGEL